MDALTLHSDSDSGNVEVIYSTSSIRVRDLNIENFTFFILDTAAFPHDEEWAPERETSLRFRRPRGRLS